MNEYDAMEKTIYVQDGQIVQMGEELAGLSGDIDDLKLELAECKKYSGRYKRSTEKRLELLREKNAKLTQYQAVVDAAREIKRILDDFLNNPDMDLIDEIDAVVNEALIALDKETE